MKTKFTETIDGSIKNIIQLKTLDNSLEFSQMFDALQDTPRDFQFKLMDALNSLGQTMGIPPTECFDKVLCASDDENPDVKKKMYNWWRAFFEILGKVVGNMPRVRSAEFTEKMDALMAEIMKSGDKESSEGSNGVVLEDGYEEADKAEENEMNKDFDFAVQHIGEIANKVKDIVNFVNPYCETKEVYDTMKKTTNERGGSDWVSMDDIVGMEVGESDWGGKSTTRTLNFTKREVDGLMDYIAEEIAHLEDETSGLNIMGIVPKRILEYIELKGFASSVKKLDPKEVIIKWADGSGVEDDFVPAKGNSKSVYDLVKDIYEGNFEYSESKVALESDWDEKPAEREEAHDKPERGTKAIVNGKVVDADSGYAEFMRIANMEPRRRHWEENTKGGEKMTPEQRKVVDNAKKAAKKDGYDQYIILDKEDGSWSFARKHIQDKSELDKFNQEVVGIVKSDDLQFQPYSLDESDEQKPDEIKDGDTKFKIGDYVSGPGLRGMVVKVYPRPSGERQRYLVKCMHGRDKGLSADMFEDELTFRHSGDGDAVTLASYGVFDVDNLMKFLKGLKPERGGIKYEIVDVKAESDEIVKVTFRTRGSNKDIHTIIAKDYIAYDVENWKISDISDPVEDKEHPGMFQTEVTLKMEYDMRGKRASSMELESDTEDKTSDELKDGDKKYKQDGETKTLVTGSDKENKKEMTDADAAAIMGGASETDMDAADMGLVSHKAADPYNNKQEVTEMTIEQEVSNPWNLAELMWGQGKENLEELLRAEVVDEEYLMQMLEDMDIHDLTSLNDAFAFDFESILEMVGCDPHAWSQNLEIKKAGDDSEEEED